MEAREYCRKTKEVEVDQYPATHEQNTVMEAMSHAPKVKRESYLQVYSLRGVDVDKPVCKSTISPERMIVTKVLISRCTEQRRSVIKKGLGTVVQNGNSLEVQGQEINI